jgi:hypothetical protein
MKQMNESKMLHITGGLDRCWWAGVTTVVNPVIGIAVAGGPSAYWNCIWAK